MGLVNFSRLPSSRWARQWRFRHCYQWVKHIFYSLAMDGRVWNFPCSGLRCMFCLFYFWFWTPLPCCSIFSSVISLLISLCSDSVELMQVIDSGLETCKVDFDFGLFLVYVVFFILPEWISYFPLPCIFSFPIFFLLFLWSSNPWVLNSLEWRSPWLSCLAHYALVPYCFASLCVSAELVILGWVVEAGSLGSFNMPLCLPQQD